MFETGPSDVHRMVVTMTKTSYRKLDPEILNYKKYNDFSKTVFSLIYILIMVLGQLPPDNCPLDNCSRTIAPQDNCPPDNCLPNNCPWTIDPQDNCPSDNCPLDNCPPNNCPQDNCSPQKSCFPGNCPRIISPRTSGAQTIAPQNN